MAGTVARMAADIRARIDGGALLPGNKLPPTKVLEQQFDMSDNAVYRTIALLKAEGYLTSVQGKGVFVADRQTLIAGQARTRGITQPGETIEHLRSVRVEPPEWVANHLGDGECVNRARLVKRGDLVKNASQSWVHVSIAAVVPEVDMPAPCDPTWQAVYRERSGKPVVLTRNIFGTRKPTEEDRELLGIPDDSEGWVPVMKSIYVVDDQVVGVSEAVAAPGEEITVPYT